MYFTSGNKSNPAQTERVKGGACLDDIVETEQRIPRFDEDMQQYIKTEADNLTIAVRRTEKQYGAHIARIRYLSNASITLYPEFYPEVLPQNDPTITRRGFEGQRVGTSATGTSVLTTFLDENGNTYDKTDAKGVVVTHTLFPDTDNIYTPEIWSEDLVVPDQVHTPTWVEGDISDRWQLLRFQRTAFPKSAKAQLKLKDNEQYSQLFRGWGPIDIAINGTHTFAGYITNRHPTLEGPQAYITSQVSIKDMWERLEDTVVPSYDFLEGRQLLDVFKDLIKKAGFFDADIEVQDPDNFLSSIEFVGFVNPNDQTKISRDGTVGEVLRFIIEAYVPITNRPIRVRWNGSKWIISIAPQYDGTEPTKKFILATAQGKATNLATDADRIAANDFYIIGNPEFTIEEPEFNTLFVRMIRGTSGAYQGLQATISAHEADPDSINDPDSFYYIGRIKHKIIQPPEIPIATDEIEITRITRNYYARHHRKFPLLEMKAEWREDVDIDDFIWVVGKNPAGNLVSYGVYRIEFFDVEVRFDIDDGRGTSGWNKIAGYACHFVGMYADATYPAFTSVLPT